LGGWFKETERVGEDGKILLSHGARFGVGILSLYRWASGWEIMGSED